MGHNPTTAFAVLHEAITASSALKALDLQRIPAQNNERLLQLI
jgi:hypothetical protein